MTTVAIILAPTGSSRLLGKVLLPLLGDPLLARVVRRVGRADRLDKVVVATTIQPADNSIVSLAEREGWPVERGSEPELPDRFVQVARRHRADVVVRITSDCPLIDPRLVDDTVARFERGQCDYVSNSIEPRTCPRGLDVEVVAAETLERAWRDDRDPAFREHATPFVYRHPEHFRLLRVASDDDESRHRWCVHTAEDFELVRRIYGALGRDDFGWRDALAVVDADPDWEELNRHVVQKALPTR